MIRSVKSSIRSVKFVMKNFTNTEDHEITKPSDTRHFYPKHVSYDCHFCKSSSRSTHRQSYKGRRKISFRHHSTHRVLRCLVSRDINSFCVYFPRFFTSCLRNSKSFIVQRKNKNIVHTFACQPPQIRKCKKKKLDRYTPKWNSQMLETIVQNVHVESLNFYQ